MAYGRRKKGGQRLMELAGTDLASRNAALRRKRALKAAKAKAAKTKASDRTRTELGTPKGTRLRPIRATEPPLRKMKGGPNLAARAGQVDPTKRTPKQPARKSAVPPSLPKNIKGRPPAHKAIINYIKENPVETAAELIALHPVAKGVKWGAYGISAAAKSKKLSSLGSKIKGLFKSKPAAKDPFKGPTVSPSKPPASGKPSRTRSGRGKETPTGKPSGRGSARGGKKPSGPGSRTSRTPRTPKRETPAARAGRKDARAQRRERLDSGGVRMGIQRRGAGLAKGRKTQAQRRADRQKRKRLNL